VDPLLPKHKCRICGRRSQTFGQDQLCADHFVEWLLSVDHKTIPSTDPSTWPVMIDDWLGRRVG